MRTDLDPTIRASTEVCSPVTRQQRNIGHKRDREDELDARMMRETQRVRV